MTTPSPSTRSADRDGLDRADSTSLRSALDRLLPALEEFNRFEGEDPTVPGAERWRAAIDTPMPITGDGLEKVVDTLSRDVVPFGLRMGAPGFCGWVTGQPTTAGAVASLAQAIAGPQRFFVHPFTLMEEVALRWISELLELPAALQGVFTSGGSTATLVALGAARQRAGEKLGHDIAAGGLVPGVSWRLYASSEVHHVVARAAGVLGMGRECVVEVRTDDRQRLDLDDLEQALESGARQRHVPLAVVATAGTVNTGAIDPIAEIAELAERYRTWLHVDGAYGLFGVLDARTKPLFEGLARADSVIVDPHKWMATPVGCGVALVRDAELLHRTFTLEPAAYLEGAVAAEGQHLRSPWDTFAGDHHNLSVEQSAPPRGAQVWATLREIGADGMRQRVTRHLDLAHRLAEHARDHERLELLAEPQLSICCFRYVPVGHACSEASLDELNEQIIRTLHASSRFTPSATRVNDRYAIRPCFINPRTGPDDVDDLARAVVDIGDSIAATGKPES